MGSDGCDGGGHGWVGGGVAIMTQIGQSSSIAFEIPASRSHPEKSSRAAHVGWTASEDDDK